MGDNQDIKVQFGNSLNNTSMLKMDQPTTASSTTPVQPVTIPPSVAPRWPVMRPTRNPPTINGPTRAYNPFTAGSYSGLAGAYSPYSSMFDSTGVGSYNRFGMSPYGMYGGGGGFGNYGFETRFAQLAEESALPAFQSVESFVHSFTSVTMMMENTYQAMLMSFRAVLRVTESVSQLKKVLADMMAAISVFKLFMWFTRRIKYFLGLLRGTPVETLAESTWDSLSQETLAPRARSAPSSWPLITFLGLMFGGPYVVHKMMSSSPPPPEPEPAPSTPGVWIPATARYDFDTQSANELPLRRGDRLLVSKDDLKTISSPQARLRPSWVLAINGTTRKQGYVPSDRLAFTQQ